jgi:hypothetical protein
MNVCVTLQSAVSMIVIRHSMTLVLLIGLTYVLSRDPASSYAQAVLVETFETDSLRIFPRRWRALTDTRTEQQIYQVTEENGNRFLRAYAEKQEIQIGLSHVFHPREFSVLQWRWRVRRLPTGGDERTQQTNDSAAGAM